MQVLAFAGNTQLIRRAGTLPFPIVHPGNLLTADKIQQGRTALWQGIALTVHAQVP